MSFRRYMSCLGLSLFLAGGAADTSADVYAQATQGVHVVKPEFFGMHFHRLITKPGDASSRIRWPALPVASLRVWDASAAWLDIMPRPGEWSWTVLDFLVNEAVLRDASVIYTFGLTPRWASARPDEKCGYGFGCAAEPARMAVWDEYVRQISMRYKGRISSYELWNEPMFSDYSADSVQPDRFYTGSVATMVEMARRARAVLDEVDPAARLFTPGFVNGPHRLDLFLEQGGRNYVQGIAYHFYDFGVKDSRWMAQSVVAVRQIMRRHQLDKLPLWNTETGVETNAGDKREDGGHTETTAPGKLAQVLILGAFSGIERFYYYAWDSDRSGMITRQGEPRPRLAVYQRMQDWLLGLKTFGCAAGDVDLVRCEGEREGERMLFLWGSEDRVRSINLPAGWRLKSTSPAEGPSLMPMEAEGRVSLSVGRTPVRLVLSRR